MERDRASGRQGAFLGLVGAIVGGLWACSALILTASAISCAQAPAAGACVIYVVAEEGASGSGARGVAFDPMPPLESLRTVLSGRGPGGQALAALELGPEGVELSLAAGAWALTASMVDEAGAALLSGRVELVLVPGPPASVRIVMRPLEGLGNVDLAYPALADPPSGAEWACRLEDEAGSIAAEWVDAASSPGRALEGLSAGYYGLFATLRVAEGVLGASVDAVRVLAGRRSPVTPSARPGRGSGAINAEADARGPLRVWARLASRLARRGIPAVLRAARESADGQADGSTDEPGGGEASYRWFSQGQELARGKLARIGTGTLPSSAAIDLLAASTDRRLGAATLELSVADGPRAGRWLHYCTLLERDEPGAPALASPVALASSADGAALAMLSDASASRLDLWLRDEAGEPRPAARAAVRQGGAARRATVLALSPDGAWAAAANGESDWLWLAPIERGQDGSASFGTALEFRSADPGLESLRYVRALAFSPDGSRLFALCSQSRAALSLLRSGPAWSIESTTLLDALPCGELSGYRAMEASPDGSLLAMAASSSDAVVILGLSGGGLSWRGMVAGAGSGIDYPQALAFSPDGRYLAVASRDAGLSLIDCRSEPVASAIRGTAAGVPLSSTGVAWVDGAIAVANPQGLLIIDTAIEGSGLVLAQDALPLTGQDLGQARGTAYAESLGPWLVCAGREPGSLALLAKGEP